MGVRLSALRIDHAKALIAELAAIESDLDPEVLAEAIGRLRSKETDGYWKHRWDNSTSMWDDMTMMSNAILAEYAGMGGGWL